MEPLTDVRDLSRIAYGFMAAKALFVALDLDLFGRVSGHPRTLAELAAATGVAAPRLATLLTALQALGLLTRDGERYANAPASEAYLVPSAKAYFGDYYRLQIDRQIYPAFAELGQAVRGQRIDFLRLMDRPLEAEQFSRAQHAGSLGPALSLARRLDLSGCRRLLDVGGGSGAFSLTLCRRYPDLTATIVDFPSVQEVAERMAREAGLADRVRFRPGSALDTPWPDGQDVVLMSYLLSNFGAGTVADLVGEAARALTPGGLLVVHDFMVRDDRSGPLEAALWLLYPLLVDPDAAALTPGWVADLARGQGLGDVTADDLIPGLTTVLTARKAPAPPRPAGG